MPLPYDTNTFNNGLQDVTLPTLRALEANPALLARSHRRFEQDSPPPYLSSTEEETDDEGGDDVDPETIRARLSEEEQEALLAYDQPLDDSELEWAAEYAAGLGSLAGPYEAGWQVGKEFLELYDEIQQHSLKWNQAPSGTFLRRLGSHRFHVLARRIIRRRWEKLGVWNPNWGFATMHETMRGEEVALSADRTPWMWQWQSEPLKRDENHPGWRAIYLRSNMRSSECVAPPPRTALDANCSQSQGDAFITSRPWFQFHIQIYEESRRMMRLTRRQKYIRQDTRNTYNVIRDRWRNAGLWKESWSVRGPEARPGWRWPHERDSPEPEDLDNFVDISAADFSPCELEEIDNAVESDSEGSPPPAKTVKDLFADAAQTPDLPPSYSAISHPAPNATTRAQNGNPGSGNPPARQRGRPQPRRQSPEANRVTRATRVTRSTTAPAPLRRSARIAALQKKHQEALAAQQDANPRAPRAARKTQAAVPAKAKKASAAVKKPAPKRKTRRN